MSKGKQKLFGVGPWIGEKIDEILAGNDFDEEDDDHRGGYGGWPGYGGGGAAALGGRWEDWADDDGYAYDDYDDAPYA